MSIVHPSDALSHRPQIRPKTIGDRIRRFTIHNVRYPNVQNLEVGEERISLSRHSMQYGVLLNLETNRTTGLPHAEQVMNLLALGLAIPSAPT